MTGESSINPERAAAPASAAGPAPGGRPIRCVIVAGSLVGLSTAIALSRLGFGVTVAEQSPARAVDGGGGLGVDVALLREVTGIDAGRVALAGDAASPMVGGGFRQGLYDVRALTRALTPVGSPDEVPEALARYGHARLAAAIRHVTSSEQETESYLAHAAAAGRTVR